MSDRHEINNNLIKKAKYYGYDIDNIITRQALGVSDTTQGKKTQRKGTVYSIRPSRNRKRGAQ